MSGLQQLRSDDNAVHRLLSPRCLFGAVGPDRPTAGPDDTGDGDGAMTDKCPGCDRIGTVLRNDPPYSYRCHNEQCRVGTFAGYRP